MRKIEWKSTFHLSKQFRIFLFCFAFFNYCFCFCFFFFFLFALFYKFKKKKWIFFNVAWEKIMIMLKNTKTFPKMKILLGKSFNFFFIFKNYSNLIQKKKKNIYKTKNYCISKQNTSQKLIWNNKGIKMIKNQQIKTKPQMERTVTKTTGTLKWITISMLLWLIMKLEAIIINR